MSLNRVRVSLFGVFVAGLLIQLAAVISVGHKMWPEELEALVLKLLAIYSVHLTIIIGAMFATPKVRATKVPISLVWVAITLTVFWNCLLLWRSLSFTFAVRDSVSDFMRYLDSVAAASAFLVTGFLAFFFTKTAKDASTKG